MTTTNGSQASTAHGVKFTITAKPEYVTASWKVTVDCDPEIDEEILDVARMTVQDYVDVYWTENDEAFWDDYPGRGGAPDADEEQEIATAFIKYLEESKAAIKKKLEDAFIGTADWDWGKTELEFK